MERNGFGASSTGTLAPTLGGRKAFVPAPLPPQRALGRIHLMPPLAGNAQDEVGRFLHAKGDAHGA